MRILHTADWHIGKKLHKNELSRDFDLFINWLCTFIEQEQIDLLLVCGDIFDLANPSSEARRQYYNALLKMARLNCKIILTGGNHDSPSMLEAPKEILRELDIHIIGGFPENPEDVIIPVQDRSGKTQIVIAALPFLRDSDLRSTLDASSYEDRLESTRKAIEQIFARAADHCSEKYSGCPAIAMGHLYAAGMETSESEREIQIGNQAAFEAAKFGAYFTYVALGHIHKPQQVSAPVPAFYSGSPLPLSFSERKDEKRIIMLDSAHNWEPKSIPVPGFRKLIKISGDLEQLKQKLGKLTAHDGLEHLIEVELQEEQYDALKLYELDSLVSDFDEPGYRIVKHRATFSKQLKGASEVYEENQQLQDLKPRDIFLELIEKHEYDPEIRQEIVSTFDELLEEIRHDEKSLTA